MNPKEFRDVNRLLAVIDDQNKEYRGQIKLVELKYDENKRIYSLPK